MTTFSEIPCWEVTSTVNAMRECPQCKTALPADAPAGLCPSCLIRAGFSTDALLDHGAGHGTAGHQIAGTRTADSSQRHHSGEFDAEREDGAEGARQEKPFQTPAVEELAAQFPHLEILEFLGCGGMGAVYKARQPGLDRLVALKILAQQAARDASFADRFSREARVLGRLNHPNIVAVYDFGHTDGLYWFIMEYVDGVNLRQLMESGGLQPHEALSLVPQLCEALQFAHDEGVVHRDIKPENILVDRRGRVKVADFGLSKLLREDRHNPPLTKSHQVMGTIRYMAPEQMKGSRTVDHRADIYSLGVVFYELLTGEVPFGRFDPPSRKVQLDVRLDQVVLRALEAEPEHRYQHASEIKTAVESALHGKPTRDSGVPLHRRHLPGALEGFEYQTKARLFGIPLIHVATGVNPETGHPRVACGIIAVGDYALGVLALGGVAAGGMVLGGVGFGLIGLGGVAIGLLAALGGAAVGGIALGGAAVGFVAVGGAAVGYYACGGAAAGMVALGGNAASREAAAVFSAWVSRELWLFIGGLLATPLLVFLAAGIARLTDPVLDQPPRLLSVTVKSALTFVLLVGGLVFLSFQTRGEIPMVPGEAEVQKVEFGAVDPWIQMKYRQDPSRIMVTSVNFLTVSMLLGVLAMLAGWALWKIQQRELAETLKTDSSSRSS